MRYGANAEIMDKEGEVHVHTCSKYLILSFCSLGLNCLHIAAQFGFTSIVAYLVTHPRFPVVSVNILYKLHMHGEG